MNGKSVKNSSDSKNSSNSKVRIMKVVMKNFHKFSTDFSSTGLRKLNIANAESIFDQNECDI